MPIELNHVSYTYMPRTPYERRALDDVTLTVREGELLAVAGHTGSGKSTLLQHLNAILSPTEGEVIIDGVNIAQKGEAALSARRKVGLVFQYPERQLFEETVAADVAFGPKTLGLSEAETEERVKEAMKEVNLDFAQYGGLSPLALSGGQMRRAAIAGVLALRPKYLVLDEPTAGLDPASAESLLSLVEHWKGNRDLAVVLVSHDMEVIARLADRMAVMAEGKLAAIGEPRQIFATEEIISRAGLKPPAVMRLMDKFRQAGLEVGKDALTLDEGARSILAALKRRGATRGKRNL